MITIAFFECWFFSSDDNGLLGWSATLIIYIEKIIIVYIVHIIRKELIILFAAIQGTRIVIETVVKTHNNGLATCTPPTWLRSMK